MFVASRRRIGSDVICHALYIFANVHRNGVFQKKHFVLADVRVFLQQIAAVVFVAGLRRIRSGAVAATDRVEMRATHHLKNSTCPISRSADLHR